jgi:thioredoxin reductase
MGVAETRRDQLFPTLCAAQIAVASRFAAATPERFAPGERLYALGERHAPVFIVTAGEVRVTRGHAQDDDQLITVLPIGGITGEVSQLGGRSALAEARAGDDGCEALRFDTQHLRALIVGSAEIGEVIMRAFLLRRTALIAVGANTLLAGRPGDVFTLRLENGLGMRARSVVVASGARYRRIEVENLALFEGAGVSYWASPVEAKLCEGEEIALVGAGNSAGQAVVFLAPRVKHLHLLVRGDSLEASMSAYLIERISALPNVTLHARAEVIALQGEVSSGLIGATLRLRNTGATCSIALRHLFLFVGADPNAAWLQGCSVEVDARGFICTGQSAHGQLWSNAGRAPLPLETSVPGVFAIGDVRAGSTKRVAAAVGEGAQVVAALHQVLAVSPVRPSESAHE